MQFEELQKIWNAQTNEPLYAINEKAMHKLILSKVKQGNQITNINELLLIIINLGAGCFIFAINFFKPPANTFLYLTAVWMFLTFVYLLTSRIRRIKGDRRFDRSMHGDLHHAISVATYQVRLSRIMLWNILPVGVLILLSAWEGRKLFWVTGLMSICFALAYYAGKHEHRFYKSRKRELEVLQEKLGGT